MKLTRHAFVRNNPHFLFAGKKIRIPSINEIMSLVKNQQKIKHTESLQEMDIFISMATKLTIKTIFLLIIVFFLTFNNVSASTISGYELENLIEDWLKKKGIEPNISILHDLKYPECENSKILINDISGNSRLIKVNCIGKNPWQFIVRNKLNLKKKVSKKKQNLSEFVVLKKL